MRLLVLIACVLSLLSCGSTPSQSAKQTEPAKSAPAPKPTDESRRFPEANLVSTRVVNSALLGKSFMPGGTLAQYKKGKAEYQMFVARSASPTDAAIALNDWRSALANPEFVASFGGYFGKDGSAPVFVFTKGEWIAGIVGLPRAEADGVARSLASRL
jgi:hypothetical protein